MPQAAGRRLGHEFVRLVVGFEDREGWQQRGGDVARHGRGHQTAQRETWDWMAPLERAWRNVFNGRVANIAVHIGRYSELFHVFDDNSLTVNSLR